MSVEFLKELELLEDRFDSLARMLGELKSENAALREASSGAEGLRGENEGLKGEIAGLRGENEELKKQVESLRADADGQREKMNTAAERVKGLLAKLDSAR